MARVKKTNDSDLVADAPASLEDFIAAREVQKLESGVVLVKVIHPQADSRIFPGRYSGIVVEQGPAGCVWSDGSTE